jgi:hypothetical protein
MKNAFTTISLFSVAACAGSANAATPEVRPSATEMAGQGTPFRLAVTETERLPTKSYLNVPGFHDRSAPGSRSLMCFYTALAIEREFAYWFVVYPGQESNRVVVAFSNAANDSPEKLLGEDYIKALALGNDMMPVAKMAALCGFALK